MTTKPFSDNTEEQRAIISSVVFKYDQSLKNISFSERIDGLAVRFARYFPEGEDRDKLYSFFNIDKGSPFFIDKDRKYSASHTTHTTLPAWEIISKRCDLLIYDLLICHPFLFRGDKILKKFASYAIVRNFLLSQVGLSFLTENYSVIYYVDNDAKYPVLNVLCARKSDISREKEGNPFHLSYNSSFVSCFSEAFISKEKKLYSNSITQPLFIKDIFSVLMKMISSVGGRYEHIKNIDDIDVINFFSTNTLDRASRTLSFVYEAKEIVQNYRYLINGKKDIKTISRLNRDTFKTLFSSFVLKEVLSPEKKLGHVPFFLRFQNMLGDNKIKNNLFFFSSLSEIYPTAASSENVEMFYSAYLSGTLLYANDINSFFSKLAAEEFLSLKRNAVRIDGENSFAIAKKILVFSPTLEEYISSLLEIPHISRRYSQIKKKLNPRRYSNKTKKLIGQDYFLEIIAIGEHLNHHENWYGSPSFFECVLDFVNITKSAGVTENNIRILLKNFVSAKYYFKGFSLLHAIKRNVPEILPHFNEKDEITVFGIEAEGVRLLHDWIIVVFEKLSNVFDVFSKAGVSPRIANDVAKLVFRYYPSNKSVNELGIELEKMFDSAYYIAKHYDDIRVSRWGDLHRIYDIKIFKENAEKNKNIKTFLGIDTEEKKSVARLTGMRKYPETVDFLNTISLDSELRASFNEKNYAKPVSLDKKRFTVGIAPHNSILGVTGSCVSGICIPSYGTERKEQTNPNFMNLVVYDQNKVYLWGLLCRATSLKGEVFYILNNFQGGVSNHSAMPAADVGDAVYACMELFLQENEDVFSILHKQFSFNSIELKSDGKCVVGGVGNLSLTLKKVTRLDFNLNPLGIIEDSFHYVGKSSSELLKNIT